MRLSRDGKLAERYAHPCGEAGEIRPRQRADFVMAITGVAKTHDPTDGMKYRREESREGRDEKIQVSANGCRDETGPFGACGRNPARVNPANGNGAGLDGCGKLVFPI